ncbi:MAG: hypothetical protein IKM42_06885 [Clostridia bacterium]|nr:hypothetical protein [Clostridia bacterium]MBR7111918.1 hypothetical protein [Clostridia bacterium]
MQNIVVNRRALLPRFLAEVLPASLCEEIDRRVPEGALVEEVRLRRDRCASVTVGGVNLRLLAVLTGAQMERLLLDLCAGSLYAHSETLGEGYLVLPSGVRVGVCGKAAVVAGRITGIESISAFSVRLPHRAPPVGGEVCAVFEDLKRASGVLLFSPPGVGKTTLLRGVAARLSGGEHPLRVALVDTRGELGATVTDKTLLLDVLSGYPRGRGIGIAVRTLSAEVIVCDEVGDLGEAREIVAAHTGGVPLIATAHAASVRELLSRPGMRLLHESRVFGAYVRVSRAEGDFSYSFDVVDWERADADF